jgi:septal ring factor EnvC (AmiA/AmiB activator)
MDNRQAEGGGSLKSLESKIDDLANGVRDMNERLSGVETRLSGVETNLADVAKQLVNVQITADETKQFSRDSWDSLESLTKNMQEGFKAAKKDRDEQSQLIHAAIRHWGERVERMEQGPPRTRKRQS